MNRPRRAKPRTNRHLKGVDASELVKQSEEAATLHAHLTAEGYVLQPGCRPYLRKDWYVSARFVWRHRATDRTATLSVCCPAGVFEGALLVGLEWEGLIRKVYGVSEPAR